MKLVDEKGRLFGKLNIIDFLVIILLVAAVALVGIKLMGKGGTSAAGGTQLTYTVLVKGVEPAAYESTVRYIEDAEGGDQLMANGETLSGWVTDVQSAPHTSVAKVATNENGEKVEIMLDANTVDLTFTIKANITNTTTNEVGTQEIRVGKTHIVKTTHFEYNGGTILTCQVEDIAEG